jgi:hypothetical protein
MFILLKQNHFKPEIHKILICCLKYAVEQFSQVMDATIHSCNLGMSFVVIKLVYFSLLTVTLGTLGPDHTWQPTKNKPWLALSCFRWQLMGFSARA